MKKRFFCLLLVVALASTGLKAQERSVQNKPYIDLRPLHFGVLVGTHLQDVEFLNVGPQIITNDDGTTMEKTITCDQVRWDAGFTVGVLAEARISEHFAFRLAPAMYFGTRHFMFNNLTDKREDGSNLTEQQDLKSVYISAAADLIFAAKRFNNHRPYIMAGINPMLNLSGASQDYLQMKRLDLFFEVHVRTHQRPRHEACRRPAGQDHAYVHQLGKRCTEQDYCPDLLFRISLTFSSSQV